MSFPKILILGQPFNDFTGGGITLSNLFKGWPSDKIAVAYTGHGLYIVNAKACNTIYQLGIEEHRWVFPFSLFQRKFPSGLKSINSNVQLESIYSLQSGIRYKLVNKVFYPCLRWIGLFHCLSKIRLSDKFIFWLSQYQPEVLYFQVSSREEILFAIELCDLLKLPSVIHMMDDWPVTIANNGLFKKYWQKKINFEFRRLLNKIDLHLSISDAMSEEYLTRYNKKFIPFHNPIETNVWLPNCKSSYGIDEEYVKILYSGRLGIGIKDSIIEVAKAIDSITNIGINIKLHIQTSAQVSDVIDSLKTFNCVVINPYVSYEELPRIFSKSDILLLANEFSGSGIDFLKYSMPTKASEYMISGTPILIYAPKDTAITKFFLKNDCGYCISSQSNTGIIEGIMYLVNNEDYRKRISQNAVAIAKDRFSAEKVREEFHNVLYNVSKIKSVVVQ